jgi:flagellar protein FlgJ
MLTPKQHENLQKAVALAQESTRKYGDPTEVAVAQCLLESDWLSNAPGNNCFGITATPRVKKVQNFITTEVINGQSVRVNRAFAAYNSLQDCFYDHGWLMTHGAPYAKAWARYQKDHDVLTFIDGIAPVYATNPSYAKALKQLLNMPEVRVALGKPPYPLTPADGLKPTA